MRIGLHTQRSLAKQLLRESHRRAYTECPPIWEEIEDSAIVDVKCLSYTAYYLVYEYGDIGIAQGTLSQSRNHGLLQGVRLQFGSHLLTLGDFVLESCMCLCQHSGLCLAFLEEARVIERHSCLRGKASEERLLVRAEIERLTTAQGQHT